MIRIVAFCLLAVSLAAGVILKGGVYPRQWEWVAAGIAIASLTLVWRADPSPSQNLEPAVSNILLTLTLAWMIFQLVPLPVGAVRWLSHDRWKALEFARAVLGRGQSDWAPLSLAPAATMERLLYVVPAMAVFVAAREVAWFWRHRIWIAVAPVIGIAFAESVLGLLQFYFMRLSAAKIESATGTYINRNHFAGLLELAFPLALLWSISVWRKGVSRMSQSSKVGLQTALLLGVAACLLAGIVVSQSRMAFLSTLIVSDLIVLVGLISQRSANAGWRSAWKWAIPLTMPAIVWIFLPTQELGARLSAMAEGPAISQDDRMEIWRDTLHMIPAHRWIGSGLGTYERAMYQYKVAAPAKTLDFAHNDYLQVLAELGIIGAALTAALMGWVLIRVVRVVARRRGSGGHWELALGLLAALVALGIHSVADFNMYIPVNAVAFAWVAGVAVSPGLRCR